MDSHTGASDSPTGNVLNKKAESADDIQLGEADDNSVDTYAKGLRDGQPVASNANHLQIASLPTPHTATDSHAADQELVARLASRGFAGREYQAFHEEMVKYGQTVCAAWIRNGTLHRKCAEQGRPLDAFPEGVERQDRWELATDTAVEGAAMFRQKALIEGKWSPDGGAALSTFYIGSCVLKYPQVYRSWLKTRIALRRLLVVQRVPEELQDGPERTVRHRLMVEQLKRQLEERDYTVLSMHSQGYKYADIALHLGATEKAVNGYLQRAKVKARKILEQLGGLGD